MRIVLISPYTEPIKGGITSYTRELFETYQAMGIETTGYSARGITNTRFAVLGPSRAAFLIRVFLRLASQECDVVHAHSHWYALFPGYVLRKLRPGVRLLFTFHTMPLNGKEGLGHRILHAMLPSCDGVTFVSRQLKEAVRLPSTIQQSVIHPAPEREAFLFRGETRIRENPTVVFVGSLVWSGKALGVSRLMEAFRTVSSKHSQWRLVVIGDGPFRTRLEREAEGLGLQGKVLFRGVVDRVFDEIAAATIYAHVSLQEGLPLSLLNAMALGKPVLATAVGGMPEVILDGVTGRLAPPSTDAIASALGELLDDEALRQRLGAAARKWVLEELSWEKVAAAHLKLVNGP